MATLKTRDDILKEMRRTRGTVFHNGVWFRKESDVPPDDVLAGNDPSARQSALRKLEDDAAQLSRRIAQLRDPRPAERDLALRESMPPLVSPPSPGETGRKEDEEGALRDATQEMRRLRDENNRLQEENQRLRVGPTKAETRVVTETSDDNPETRKMMPGVIQTNPPEGDAPEEGSSGSPLPGGPEPGDGRSSLSAGGEMSTEETPKDPPPETSSPEEKPGEPAPNPPVFRPPTAHGRGRRG